MEYLSVFVLGVFIKVITGIDDVLTRIPVVAAITRTRMGKVAFCSGSVLAVTTATVIAFSFSSLIASIPHYRTIVVCLIFLLAILIQCDVFVHKPRKKAEKKLLAMQQISLERFTKLLGIGFLTSFATVLDDVVAYLPLFLVEPHLIPFGLAGLLAATLAQAVLVIYFAERLARIPYKEEIAAGGLVLLGVGILLGWI